MITYAIQYDIEDKETLTKKRFYFTHESEKQCIEHCASLRLLGFKGNIYIYEVETAKHFVGETLTHIM